MILIKKYILYIFKNTVYTHLEILLCGILTNSHLDCLICNISCWNVIPWCRSWNKQHQKMLFIKWVSFFLKKTFKASLECIIFLGRFNDIFILFRRNVKSKNEQCEILFLKCDSFTSVTSLNLAEHTWIRKKKAKFTQFIQKI